MYKSKRLIKYLIICLALIATSFLLSFDIVEASYKYCDKKVPNTDYYDCGNYIYTYYEDTLHSSIIYSSDEEKSILYVGEKDGVSIFYADGLRYYNRSYDDRSDDNNNLWTILSSRGEIIFDGSFDDSWIINDSHEGYYYYNLNLDVYTIRQYANDGKLYRTIAIYNIEDGEVEFINAQYDGTGVISSGTNEVLDCKNNFNVTMSGLYGIKTVEVNINNTTVASNLINSTVYVYKDVMNNSLLRGEVVDIEIIAKDYFGKKNTKTYKFLLLNNIASIEFSTITSITESASRRIVVNASPGKGKTLDTDYCWYYWSTSPDDSLLYDDFLKNYALSSYKGSYSEDKGVILRDTSGTYYLYALAKDEDSYIVAKSEGYALNDYGYKVYYNINDAIFIVSLLILCVVPVAIYLYIRKKGY